MLHETRRSGIADAGLSRLAAGSPELRELKVSGCLSITASGPERLSALGKLEKADFDHCRYGVNSLFVEFCGDPPSAVVRRVSVSRERLGRFQCAARQRTLHTWSCHDLVVSD